MAKRVSLKGRGADLFFGDPPAPQANPSTDEATAAATPPATAQRTDASSAIADLPDGAAAMAVPAPRAQPPRRGPDPSSSAKRRTSDGASMLASTLLGGEHEDVEAIRRVVKTPGKEVSFVRLSTEEKGELADVVHAYKRRGLKTSETEINRIAINALLADHRSNGERSVLARVLAALRA